MNGMYKISNRDYHNGPGVSSSDLKELLKSAAHYLAYKQTPQEPSPQMIKGSLVHALILEPEIIEKQFVVGDFKIRRGKDYDRVLSDNPDKTIVSRDEYAEALRIADSFVRQANEREELKALTEGIKETAFYWECETTGVCCKIKPDVVTCSGIVVDIKTTSDASFDAFQKQLVDLKYFLSAAFYLRGLNKLQILPGLNEFIFLVIETKPPYSVATYKLDENAIEIGNMLIDQALSTYAEAVSTDQWAGYPRRIIEIGLPAYAMYKLNYIGGKL